MDSKLVLPIILCLALGLAPFFPEPHIVKQALNLWHGRPMGAMDYLDILLHGGPFVYLAYLLLRPSRK